MASEIGYVKSIEGAVKVIGVDGIEKVVVAGEALFENDVVVTGAAGNAVLSLENGHTVEVGADEQLSLDSSVSVDAAADDAVVGDVAALQAALLAGEELEPTAAGPEGGAGSSGLSGGGVYDQRTDDRGDVAADQTPDAWARSFPESELELFTEEEEEVIPDPVPVAATPPPPPPPPPGTPPPVIPPPVTLVPDNDGVQVNEAALDTGGSDPTSDAETITGDLNVAGAVSYVLNGTGIGIYGTLTITNAATGEYSYTLTSPMDSGPTSGANVVNDVETFSYTATDAAGNTVVGTITVDIVDDIPSISVDIVDTEESEQEGGFQEPTLQVDESDFDVDDTAVSFAGSFTNTSDAGADGQDGAIATTYTLGITADTDSGLVDTASGEAVILSVNATGDVVGKISTGEVVFTVSTDNDGNVTLDQARAMVHPDSPDNHDEPISLSDELITLTREDTITDNDGDTATDDATLDIGANLIFRDDGPDAEAVVDATAKAKLDETDFATGTVGEDSATITASTIQDLFATPDHGEDGAGTVEYSLDNTGSENTGLFLTGDDGSDPTTEIVLTSTATGYAGMSGTVEAFTVDIDSTTGEVTVTLSETLEHLTDGDTPAAHNDALNINGLISVVQTITDGDGDTDSATSDSALKIIFRDDGPTSNTIADMAVETLTVDESPVPLDGDGVVSDSADYASNFGTSVDYGEDGAGTVDYGLVLDGADMGTELYALDATATDGKGEEITLEMSGDDVIGTAGGETYFTISNTDSTVTFTQNTANTIWHDDTADHDDDETLAAATGTVGLEQTVTDADGDTASSVLDLSDGVFILEDDGPTSNTIADMAVETLTVDESPVPLDGDGVVSDSADYASNFGTSVDYGEDGAGTVDYGLVLDGADMGTELYALDATATDGKGEEITLEMSGDDVIGTAGGETYFTISNTDSTVTFTQNTANTIWHDDTADHDDDETLAAATGTVGLEQTVTDADGDTASSVLDLSDGVFILEDDGPTSNTIADMAVETLTVDESPVPLDGDGVVSDSADYASNFGTSVDYGEDGAGTVDYGLVLDGADMGTELYALDATATDGKGEEITLEMSGDDVIGTAGGETYFTISNTDSTVTFTQNTANTIWHDDTADHDDDETLAAATGTVGLEQTVTDADGDTASSVLDLSDGVFILEDDGPTSNTIADMAVETLTVDESPVPLDGDGVVSDSADYASNFGTSVDYGEDGAGTVDYGLVLDGADMGTELYALDATATDGKGEEITLEMSGDDVIGTAGGETYFTISNTDSTVTFTQNTANTIWHDDTADHDDDETLAAATGTVGLEQTVTDADGDTASSVLDLSDGVFILEDDGPTSNTIADMAVETLTVDESPVPLDGDGVVSDSADYASNFGTSVDYGEDGAGTVDYGLVLDGADMGTELYALDATATDGKGEEITLEMSGDDVIGTAGGETYFTISNTDSTVTFTQNTANTIWHDDTADHDDDETLAAATGTVGLEQTVTDADGDTASSVLDLSDGVFILEDDGPTSNTIADMAVETLTVDESPVPLDGDGVVSDSADYASNFGTSVDYGEDGAGTVDYGLVLDGADMGTELYALDATATDGKGEEITLEMSGDDVIGTAGGETYFTISNTDSTVTFTQNTANTIWHDDTADHDDDETLAAATGTVGLEQTVTDADGDTASSVLDLSDGVFILEDDGPTSNTIADMAVETLTVDESPVPLDGDGVVSDSADYASNFGTSVDYGEDGAGTVDYGLVLDGADMGTELYALDATATDGKGEEITLEMSGDDVIGTAGGETYFTISNTDSTVTFTQNTANTIWHDDTADHDDDETLAAATGTVGLEQTVTDADGDTASSVLDLSDGVFILEDDGPTSNTIADMAVETLTVDESPVPLDGDGVVSDSADYASNFGTSVDYGEDGAGTVDYGLVLDGADMGTELYALDATATDGKGEEITLEMSGDDVIGTAGGETYFTISNTDSTVTFTQNTANTIWHDDTADHDDDETLAAATGTVGLEQTVTDADGDTASSVLDLSDGVFILEDDGPDAEANPQAMASAEVDETDFATGTVGEDSDTIDAATIQSLFATPLDYGEDGAGTVVYSLDNTTGSANTGLFLTGDDGSNPATEIVLVSTATGYVGMSGTVEAFTVDIDSDTGEVIVTQSETLEHLTDGDTPADHDDTLDLDGLISVVQTITDGDGDTDSATSANALDIMFRDDGPAVEISENADGSVVTDETSDLGDTITGTTSVFTYDTAATTGADGGTTEVSLDITHAATGFTTTDGDYDITLVADATDSSLVHGQYTDGNNVLQDAFTVSIAADGKLSVTQNEAMVHPINPDNYDEPIDLTGMLDAVVTVTDGDGDIATDNIAVGDNISFEDDGPTVNESTDTVIANQNTDTNIVLTLDVSGSMGSGSGSKFEIAQDSLINMINSYNELGTVNVNLTYFSTEAFNTEGWMTYDEAITYITDLTPTGGWTNYESAVDVTEDSYGTPPEGADQTVAYFISDGVPTKEYDSNLDVVTSDGTGDKLDDSYVDSWDDFINDNNIGLEVVGVDLGANPSASAVGYLNKVQVTDADVLYVEDPEDLSDAIAPNIDPVSATADLGIDVGEDLAGATVSLTDAYDDPADPGDDDPEYVINSTNGDNVQSNGIDLVYISDPDNPGGLLAVTDPTDPTTAVLSVTPDINADGSTSYTTTILGVVDEQENVTTITETFTFASVESVDAGNFDEAVLTFINGDGDEITATVSGHKDTGDDDNTGGIADPGDYELTQDSSTSVNVSGQRMGVASNLINNTDTGQEDYDGQVLKISFDDAVDGVSLKLDKLDGGDQALWWTTITNSDGTVDVVGSGGFTSTSGSGAGSANDGIIDISSNGLDGIVGNDSLDNVTVNGGSSLTGAFDTVYLSSASGASYGTLLGDFTVTVTEEIHEDVPLVLEFEALVTDGDGDTATTTFDVTIDGDSVLEGSDGPDVIVGSAADEILIGGDGADTLDGGDGDDTVSYEGDTDGVTVDLDAGTGTGGDAEGDTISNVENITGGDGDDTLTGDANDNIIDGGAGDDTIDGGAGNDTIDGGAGDDSLTGGDGADTFVAPDPVEEMEDFNPIEGDIVDPDVP